jgi:hypothetical protein
MPVQTVCGDFVPVLVGRGFRCAACNQSKVAHRWSKPPGDDIKEASIPEAPFQGPSAVRPAR